MNIAVQTFYIPVLGGYGADTVYPTRVWIVFRIFNADFTVCHCVERELFVIVGEITCTECCSVSIFTVYQTVHYYHIADRVYEALVGECIPTGLWNDALDAQGVQI